MYARKIKKNSKLWSLKCVLTLFSRVYLPKTQESPGYNMLFQHVSQDSKQQRMKLTQENRPREKEIYIYIYIKTKPSCASM